ncbi:MAG: antitermination protein NusB [Flavobacteriales bacterium]|jgi:N utilization substance protein B|nr:antitermination protein NusB [Flavobacteriales bacterium]
MLNRRHLRIKVLQTLYAFTQSNNTNLVAGEKELLHGVEKMYDLYIYYLTMFDSFTHFAELKIEEAKRKIFTSEEDLNPNLKFVNNRFLALLKNNKAIKDASLTTKINWSNDVEQDVLTKLFNSFTKNDIYNEYMEKESSSFEEDKKFIVKLFKKEICNFELLLHFFEEKSVYWQDDIDLVCSMVIKTLKSFKSPDDIHAPILPLYKDDEESFIKALFRKGLNNLEDNYAIISKYTKNWESDRIALMDRLLMNLAITEAKAFEYIPTKVTLNEYIEISKFYSTPKSNTFINGVLDKIFDDLKKEGAIKKVGRGLLN